MIVNLLKCYLECYFQTTFSINKSIYVPTLSFLDCKSLMTKPRYAVLPMIWDELINHDRARRNTRIALLPPDVHTAYVR